MDLEIVVPTLPPSWRFGLLVTGAMVLLAAFDFMGAVFAKEWAARGRLVFLAGGIASFVALFVVYARVLRFAELSVVTIGWIVMLQVGLVAMDRLHYGVGIHWSKWLVVVLMLGLQLYLLLGPDPRPGRR